MTTDESLYGVCYKSGEPTLADYDEAIKDLRAARRELKSGDKRWGCSICTDSGHSADMCHHNPLLLARQWAKAKGVWQCWHCGFIATNDADAVEHFGKSEQDIAKCSTAITPPRAFEICSNPLTRRNGRGKRRRTRRVHEHPCL
jgi:hypothetical protein